MAGRLDPEAKARLIEAGRWEAFKGLREELKLDGFSARDATNRALEELDCEDADDPDYAGPPRPPKPPPASAGPDGELLKAPLGLAGKFTAEPEVIRWVARHIDHPAPSPKECPDPFAWTLLRLCRKSDDFQRYFTEKLWGKLIPTRSQLDTTGAGQVDGKVPMDLIEELLAWKAEVEGKKTPEEER